ncbi:MAG: hypothetical protein J1E82_09440 [Muribaculaceae bacterium]|nr:hypothetical protein [Muribaculaceae bacterium]
MKKIITILALLVGFACYDTATATELSPQKRSSSKKTSQKAAINLPDDFYPELFFKYDPDNEFYTWAPVSGKDLEKMGFTLAGKGTAYILTGTDPESYKKVASYTYVYKGIKVTINQYGRAISIEFPNKKTLDQFLYIGVRNLPFEIYNNRYSLPGLAAYYYEGLKLTFDFDP